MARTRRTLTGRLNKDFKDMLQVLNKDGDIASLSSDILEAIRLHKEKQLGLETQNHIKQFLEMCQVVFCVERISEDDINPWLGECLQTYRETIRDVIYSGCRTGSNFLQTEHLDCAHANGLHEAEMKLKTAPVIMDEEGDFNKNKVLRSLLELEFSWIQAINASKSKAYVQWEFNKCVNEGKKIMKQKLIDIYKKSASPTFGSTKEDYQNELGQMKLSTVEIISNMRLKFWKVVSELGCDISKHAHKKIDLLKLELLKEYTNMIIALKLRRCANVYKREFDELVKNCRDQLEVTTEQNDCDLNVHILRWLESVVDKTASIILIKCQDSRDCNCEFCSILKEKAISMSTIVLSQWRTSNQDNSDLAFRTRTAVTMAVMKEIRPEGEFAEYLNTAVSDESQIFVMENQEQQNGPTSSATMNVADQNDDQIINTVTVTVPIVKADGGTSTFSRLLHNQEDNSADNFSFDNSEKMSEGRSESITPLSSVSLSDSSILGPLLDTNSCKIPDTSITMVPPHILQTEVPPPPLPQYNVGPESTTRETLNTARMLRESLINKLKSYQSPLSISESLKSAYGSTNDTPPRSPSSTSSTPPSRHAPNSSTSYSSEPLPPILTPQGSPINWSRTSSTCGSPPVLTPCGSRAATMCGSPPMLAPYESRATTMVDKNLPQCSTESTPPRNQLLRTEWLLYPVPSSSQVFQLQKKQTNQKLSGIELKLNERRKKETLRSFGIQYTTNGLIVGVFVDGQPNILIQKSLDEQFCDPKCARIPLDVELTKNEEIIFGKDVTNNPDKWNISDLFGKQYKKKNTEPKSQQTICVHGIEMKVYPEVLLAIILTRVTLLLKQQVSNVYGAFKVNFTNVIISVPPDLPFAQLQQIKDSAIIAGFSPDCIAIFSEASCAAFDLYTQKHSQSTFGKNGETFMYISQSSTTSTDTGSSHSQSHITSVSYKTKISKQRKSGVNISQKEPKTRSKKYNTLERSYIMSERSEEDFKEFMKLHIYKAHQRRRLFALISCEDSDWTNFFEAQLNQYCPRQIETLPADIYATIRGVISIGRYGFWAKYRSQVQDWFQVNVVDGSTTYVGNREIEFENMHLTVDETNEYIDKLSKLAVNFAISVAECKTSRQRRKRNPSTESVNVQDNKAPTSSRKRHRNFSPDEA